MSTALNHFPTPRDMIAHLDRFVLGQDCAKRELVTCFNNHFLGAAYSQRHPEQKNPFGRNHMLLLGPTGSGKSYIVKTLCEFLGVPFYHAGAKSLVEVGYVGQQVDTLLRGLLLKAGRNLEMAQRGIVFIDEIDKLRRSRMSERDVSGEGVQNSLLTYLDGQTVSVKMEGDGMVDVNTSEILFIGAGAFVGLTDIVRKRLRTSTTIGFSSGAARSEPLDEDAALEAVTAEDLETFGFIPELIGRFATISSLHSLTVEDYVTLLRSSEENASYKIRRLFSVNGIELRFTTGALNAVARRARDSGLGVRGLEQVMKETVSDLTWQLEDLAGQGVTRVLITEEVVLGSGEPVMTHDPARSPDIPPVEQLRMEAGRLFRPDRPVFGEERIRPGARRLGLGNRRKGRERDLFEGVPEE